MVTKIPAKQLQTQGTLAALKDMLLDRETGWCTDDNILYYNDAGVLKPVTKVVVIEKNTPREAIAAIISAGCVPVVKLDLQGTVYLYPVNLRGNDVYTFASPILIGSGNTKDGYYWATVAVNGTWASGFKDGAKLPMRLVEGEITNNGKELTCTGENAWAEGDNATASGHASHSEGFRTIASGDSSHAEGRDTKASGDASHASGYGTRATGEGSTAVGKFNDDGNALFVVGNGTNTNNRKDVFKVDRDGNIWVAIGGVLTEVENVKKPVQFVLVRENMADAFTAKEYQDCVNAANEGMAVCVQYSSEGISQINLVNIRDDGSLEFAFSRNDKIYTYVVSPNNSHYIVFTTRTIRNPNAVLNVKLGGQTRTYTPTGSNLSLDIDSEVSRIYIAKGSANVSTLNAGISGIQNGWSYVLTDSGTLTLGSVSVSAGDNVAWDGSKWFKVGNQVNVNALYIVQNDEYLFALVDSNDVFLFGIKNDASIEWAEGIPTPIKNILDKIVSSLNDKVDKIEGKGLIDTLVSNSFGIISNEEFIFAIVDANDVVLFGIDHKGNFAIKDQVESIIDDYIIKFTEEFVFAICDKDNNLLIGFDKYGNLHSTIIEDFVNKQIKNINSMDYAYVDEKVESERERAESAEDDLRAAIDNLNPTIVEGGSNNPDEQFLTAINDAITFKDRSVLYNNYKLVFIRQLDNFSTKVNSQNTIYVISFSHDLGGNVINLPSGVTLLFNGGCVYNGILNGDATKVLSKNDYCFGNNLSFTGTWDIPLIRAKFFKNYASTNELKKVNSLLSDDVHNKIVIDSETTCYFTPSFDDSSLPDSLLSLSSHTELVINGKIKVNANGHTHYNTLSAFDKSDIEITGGGSIEGDADEHDYETIQSTHEWCHGIAIRYSDRIKISQLNIHSFPGDGITIDGNNSKNSENVLVDNLSITHCGRQGISIEGASNISVCNCAISDIYRTAPKAAIDIEPWLLRRAENISIENIIIESTMGIDICHCDNVKIKNIKIVDSKLFLFKDCKNVDVKNVFCADADNGRTMILAEDGPQNVSLKNVVVNTENLIYLQLSNVKIDESCKFGGNEIITAGPAICSTKFENSVMSYFNGTQWVQF